MNKDIFLDFIKSFGLFLVVILAALILIFVFWFMIIGARNDFLEKNNEFNVLAAKRASMLQVRREHEGLQILEARLESSFVNKDKAVEFIEFMEAAARNTGNSIDITSASEAADIQNFKIVIGGSYPNFINFLAQLENSPYLVRVAGANLNKSFDPSARSDYLRTSLDVQTQSLP